MKIGLRQKINIFISAGVAGTLGSMLATSYGLDSAAFYWSLGALLIAAGLATMLMDVLGKQITTGSSDVILGTEKIAAGIWVLAAQKTAQENVRWLLGAIALYHAVYLVQQAVEVRRLQRSRMAIFLTTAALSLIAAAAVAFLPEAMAKYMDAGVCMILDCAALLIAGVSLLLVRQDKTAAAPAKSAPAVRPASSVRAAPAARPEPASPAASAAATAPLGAPVLPLTDPASAAPVSEETSAPAQASSAEESTLSEQPAAEAEPAAPAPSARQQREDRENTAAASDALKSFGRFAGKLRDRTVKTASATVSGFKDGLKDGQPKQ